MVFEGADVAELQQLSTQFMSAAQTLEGNLSMLTRAVHDATWMGPEADEFRATWSSRLAPLINGAVSYLSHGAGELRQNAEQQEATSNGSGSSSTSPGNGPGSQGNPGGLPDLLHKLLEGADDILKWGLDPIHLITQVGEFLQKFDPKAWESLLEELSKVDGLGDLAVAFRDSGVSELIPWAGTGVDVLALGADYLSNKDSFTKALDWAALAADGAEFVPNPYVAGAGYVARIGIGVEQVLWSFPPTKEAETWLWQHGSAAVGDLASTQYQVAVTAVSTTVHVGGDIVHGAEQTADEITQGAKNVFHDVFGV